MTGNEIIKLLKNVGGYHTDDHVVLTSGRHSNAYLDFRPLYLPKHTETFELLCEALADRFRIFNDIENVVGPETGGVKMCELVAAILSRIHHRHVKAVPMYKRHDVEHKEFFVEPDDGPYLYGKVALVVDDVLTSGSSLDVTLRLLRRYEANARYLGVFADRNPRGNERFSISVYRPLLRLTIESWSENECRKRLLCSRGVPINTKIGHGAEFVAKYGQPSI